MWRRYKQTHSKTAKYPGLKIKDLEKISVIKNPELDKHRRAFLGKPGSEEWQKYYAGLIRTKQAMGHTTIMRTKTRKNMYSGGLPQKKDCSIKIGWLIDLFETDDMADLLVFIKRQVDAGQIKVPDAWKNSEQDIDIQHFVNEIIKNPKKGPCNAEDIKIQYIPFFLQVYMQLISDLNEYAPLKNTSDTFSSEKNESADNPAQPPAEPTVNKTIQPDKTNDNVTSDSNNKHTSNISAAISAAVAARLPKVLGGNNNSASNAAAVSVAVAASINASQSEKGKTNTEQSEKEQSEKEQPESEDTYQTSETQNNKDDETKLREMLLFTIHLLRNMNMYANPVYFDDLYYYYYFLSLDKIMPNMDDFFRASNPPDPDYIKSKHNSKTNVKMRVYQQFPNDDPSKEAQDEKHYGYEMVESRVGEDPNTNFDLFLNLVQLHPDFNYKIPVTAEVERDFTFKEVPVDDKKSQKFAKIQVVKPKMMGGEARGGAIFDSIYSVFGVSSSAGEYKYLEDNPIARDFEDVLKDETDTYDGNVHLCIYSLDTSCDFDGNGPTPFLKFITVKNGEKWGFPSFHYTSIQDPEENNTGFKCELFDKLLQTLELQLCGGQMGGNEGQKEQPVPLDKQTQQATQDANIQPPSEEPNQVEPQPPQDANIQPPSEEPNQIEHQPTQDANIQPPSEEPNQVEPQPTQDANVNNPLDNQMQQDTSTQKNTNEPKTIEEFVSPELAIIHSAKEQCKKIESELDSMYVGLLAEEVQGNRQIFAFLNYDYLETIVQTPENKAQSGLLFCRNPDSKLYPICDANSNAKLKWATVDELLFEKKIINDDVDPGISELFLKNNKLWNIEDSEGNDILFPFVVFGVNVKQEEKQYQTVATSSSPVDSKEDPFVLHGKTEIYGTPQNKEENGIADEYDERYCFTLRPLADVNPRRYAMFAWKTRYIVSDEQVRSLGQNVDNGEPAAGPEPDTQPNKEPDTEPQQDTQPNKEPDTEPQQDTDTSPSAKNALSESESVAVQTPNPLKLEFDDSPVPPLKLELDDNDEPELSEENKDRIALEKLKFPTIYTITQNELSDNKPLVTWCILNSNQFTGL
jgi:hypothetical protein